MNDTYKIIVTTLVATMMTTQMFISKFNQIDNDLDFLLNQQDFLLSQVEVINFKLNLNESFLKEQDTMFVENIELNVTDIEKLHVSMNKISEEDSMKFKSLELAMRNTTPSINLRGMIH